MKGGLLVLFLGLGFLLPPHGNFSADALENYCMHSALNRSSMAAPFRLSRYSIFCRILLSFS